jgi:hypothetical protein
MAVKDSADRGFFRRLLWSARCVSDGSVDGVASPLARHGEFSYQSIETAEVDVRRYDKTAIVRCVQRSRSTWRGQDMSLAVRLSQVWIWRPAGWQLAAIQFSTLGSG